MIPKIIHYCWLSEDKFPPLIDKCISSWKQKVPDYEFVLWDTKRFDLNDNIWVKQAFESKKYAFAADYIRLYAVYNYGGIYLDSDIELYKSFDDLLSLPYFIGSEGNGIIEAGIFGAEKGCSWIGECLKYYDNRKFILETGSLDTLTLPRIMMSQISKTKQILEVNKEILFQIGHEDISRNLYMLPKDYFCAKNHGTGQIEQTRNTYAIHHFAMSWIDPKTRRLSDLKKKLMKIIGVKTISSIIVFFKLRQIKEKFLK